jgi:hypothetical protein
MQPTVGGDQQVPDIECRASAIRHRLRSVFAFTVDPGHIAVGIWMKSIVPSR